MFDHDVTYCYSYSFVVADTVVPDPYLSPSSHVFYFFSGGMSTSDGLPVAFVASGSISSSPLPAPAACSSPYPSSISSSPSSSRKSSSSSSSSFGSVSSSSETISYPSLL